MVDLEDDRTFVERICPEVGFRRLTPDEAIRVIGLMRRSLSLTGSEKLRLEREAFLARGEIARLTAELAAVVAVDTTQKDVATTGQVAGDVVVTTPCLKCARVEAELERRRQVKAAAQRRFREARRAGTIGGT